MAEFHLLAAELSFENTGGIRAPVSKDLDESAEVQPRRRKSNDANYATHLSPCSSLFDIRCDLILAETMTSTNINAFDYT